MKSIDWTADEADRVVQRKGNQLTYSARRVLVGSCPSCEAPLVVFNDNESWPLVACACGWKGDTLSMIGGILYATGERGKFVNA